MLAMHWAPVALALAVAWAPACGTAQQVVSGETDAAEASAGGAGSGALRPVPDDVDLSPEFLEDPAHVKAGRKLWKQCRHCHGKASYPGKGPKLKPGRYDAAFVYDRITYGFEKMPPWKDVFDEMQRAQLVAYILSNRFSP